MKIWLLMVALAQLMPTPTLAAPVPVEVNVKTNRPGHAISPQTHS
jgi:hypothetical protein